jgi:hypothetical protein
VLPRRSRPTQSTQPLRTASAGEGRADGTLSHV